MRCTGRSVTLELRVAFSNELSKGPVVGVELQGTFYLPNHICLGHDYSSFIRVAGLLRDPSICSIVLCCRRRRSMPTGLNALGD